MAERPRDSSDHDPKVQEALAGFSRRLRFPINAQTVDDLLWQAGDQLGDEGLDRGEIDEDEVEEAILENLEESKESPES